MSVLESRFPFQLALPQVRTEELFAERAAALGAEKRPGHRVTGLDQDEAGVAVTVEGPGGGYTERARFVVGCYGARSIVRDAAGIGFEGRGTTRTAMLGDVELSEPPAGGTLSVHGPDGSLLVVPLPGGRFRMVAKDLARLHVPRSVAVTLGELRDSTRRIIGCRPGPGQPHLVGAGRQRRPARERIPRRPACARWTQKISRAQLPRDRSGCPARRTTGAPEP